MFCVGGSIPLRATASDWGRNGLIFEENEMAETLRVIRVSEVSVNPMSGVTRWRIPARDVKTLMEWEGFNIDHVRGCRGVRKDGTIHFTTGGGYAIFDADLLGGNGDGMAERRFNAAGFVIR